MKNIYSVFCLIFIVFVSCRSAKHRNAIVRTMDTISVSAFNNPLDIYRATSPKAWNIIHTRVALSFDYKNRTAFGEEWLTLQPYFYATDSIVLDAKGMKIEHVTIGQADKPLAYTYDSNQLHIKLDKQYTKDELVKLSIKYTAMPYAAETGGSAAITDDRGLYFINHNNEIEGKPIQIWTQGETEANSHWLPTIDKPNSRTTIQIELTVPRQYKTLSNGALISSMDKGDTRTDIWRMDKQIQVYAIMFAIGDFAIAKDSWRGKEVNYYVEPSYATYAQKMFQHTPEMIEFFSNLTGVPYPWNKYSQVVVRDYVSGAMENTSASLFGEFMNQNHREYADENHEDVVSHELFHQWFGDYVTAESWSNITVNESFATYGEYLWRKHKYGIDYAKELAYSDLHKYLNYSDYSDNMLVRHHYKDKEDMFDRVSYQKGGAILHYLHQLIGDSAFYLSMNKYLTVNALQSAEATHWRLAIEEATGQDWHWFFDQWYYRAGHPVLDIKYTYDDAEKKLNVQVSQIQNDNVGLYQLPLEVWLLDGKATRKFNWNLTKKVHNFQYDYVDGVAPVLLPDAAHVLPGIIQENKTYKEWLWQMMRTSDYISQLQAINNIKTKDLSQAHVIEILKLGVHNKIAAIRTQSLALISFTPNEEIRKKWKNDVIVLAENDGNNQVRAAATNIIGLWEMKDQYSLLQSLIKDSSYLVAGNALKALFNISDSLGYNAAKQNIAGRPNTNLDNVAWGIVSAKAMDIDTAVFKRHFLASSDLAKRDHLMANCLKFFTNTNNLITANSFLKWYSSKLEKTMPEKNKIYAASLLRSTFETLTDKLKNDKKNTLLQAKLNLIKVQVEALKAVEIVPDLIKIYQSMGK